MSDVNTKEIDFGRAESLLNVVHLCAGVGPKLTSLGNAAMTELTKINDAIKVAAAEAEQERIRQAGYAEAQQIDESANPTEPDPDEGLKDTLKLPVHPQGSQTATIADNNVSRRL